MKQLVILVNGEAPKHPMARKALANARWLVCSDGAYRTAAAQGCVPDLVVGDGDSLAEEDKIALGNKWVHIAEQDTNDLDKAFRTGVAHFPEASEVVILGAGGLREDHFLGNLFRMPGFASRTPGIDVRMITNAGVFTVCTASRTYECCPRDPVSVFAPTPGTHITSVGLEWPLNGLSLCELWMGTLNRTTDFSFTLNSDKPIIVYCPYRNDTPNSDGNKNGNKKS